MYAELIIFFVSPQNEILLVHVLVYSQLDFAQCITIANRDYQCIMFKYVLKRVSFGSKDCTKELKLECAYSWARLASFSDPLIASKFHNETHDPKGQENKIYTIVKGRETFYRRHTVPVTSCSEVKYVLKRVSFGSKDCTKELKLECAYFLGH